MSSCQPWTAPANVTLRWTAQPARNGPTLPTSITPSITPSSTPMAKLAAMLHWQSPHRLLDGECTGVGTWGETSRFTDVPEHMDHHRPGTTR